MAVNFQNKIKWIYMPFDLQLKNVFSSFLKKKSLLRGGELYVLAERSFQINKSSTMSTMKWSLTSEHRSSNSFITFKIKIFIHSFVVWYFSASPADMEKYRPMAADSLTLLIPVIVIGIFIVLLTIDIVAYKLCGCGITSCICVHLCHRKGRDRVNAKNSDGRDG